MRLHALCLTGALLAAAIPLSAGAVPVAADRDAGASARQAASYNCPPGYYWEPDGDAPHGKFRPAHCAFRW